MASKRRVKRKDWKRSELKGLRRVSERAQAEVARLLERNQAGDITRVELQTGLKEVEERLLDIINFHYFK